MSEHRNSRKTILVSHLTCRSLIMVENFMLLVSRYCLTNFTLCPGTLISTGEPTSVTPLQISSWKNTHYSLYWVKSRFISFFNLTSALTVMSSVINDLKLHPVVQILDKRQMGIILWNKSKHLMPAKRETASFHQFLTQPECLARSWHTEGERGFLKLRWSWFCFCKSWAVRTLMVMVLNNILGFYYLPFGMKGTV